MNDIPISQIYRVERDTVTLQFKDKSFNGEYYVRGGVCWPVAVRTSDGRSAVGHAVIVGYNLQTKTYTVFDEQDFICVDPILEAGKVTFDGVANWLNQCWATFYCHYFYWHQDETTHRLYLMQVLRSAMIQPKPGFIEIPWMDEQAVVPVMWRLGGTGRLKIDSGVLHDQLRRFQVELGAYDLCQYPAVHALVCALSGMERWPWREKR